MWMAITDPQNDWSWKVPVERMWSKPPSQAWPPITMPRQFLIISKDGGTTTPLGNLYQCLVTLRVKKCFLMLWQSLLCFIFVPIATGNVTGHHWKELALSSLHPLFRYVHTLIRFPWAFSSADWTVPDHSAFPDSRDSPALQCLCSPL